MAKDKSRTQLGRPKTSIKVDIFENLCRIQCTEDEICAVLGVCKSTLLEWVKDHYDGQTFQDIFKKLSMAGKASLRRTQWQQAKDNYKMSIWLGKQYLGQRDNVEVSTSEEQLDKLDEILGNVRNTAARMRNGGAENTTTGGENEDDSDDIEEI